MLSSLKKNFRGLVTRLPMAVLWLLLTWQIAIAVRQVPARSVSGWVTLIFPPATLAMLLLLIAVMRAEGRFIWSPSEAIRGLKEDLIVLPGLFLAALLLAVTGFLLMESLGYYLAWPIVLALLCLVFVLTLSIGWPVEALALFFVVYPILSFIQVQGEYWDQRAMSVVLLPVDVIDSSLLNSSLADLVQMPSSVIFMLALAGGWLIAVFRKRVILSRTLLDWPLTIFVLCYLVSCLLSVNISTSIAYVIEAILAPVLLYYVTVHSVRSERDLQVVLLAMLSSGIAAFLYHLQRLSLGGAGVALLEQSLLFANSNLVGGLLLLSLPIAIVLAAEREQRAGVRVVASVSLLACVVELFLGGSRGAWIAAAAQLTLLSAFSKRVRAYACGFALPLLGLLAYLAPGAVATIVEDRLGLVFVGEVPTGVSARLSIWQGSLDLIAEHALTGIGPGTFKTAGIYYSLAGQLVETTEAHNLLLSIAAEAGIIAALAFLCLSLMVVAKGIRDCRTAEGDNLREVLFSLVVSVIGFWIVGLTTGTGFSHNHVLAGTPMLWAIIGLIVVGRNVQHE